MARGLIDRFKSFAVPRADSDCWAWAGNKHKQGYGKISLMGKAQMAHRVSYELFKGSTKGLMVCHSCDNPECTNPEHLFLGTAMDNMQDKIKKGRHKGAAKGSGHHLAKLSDSDVKEIREVYAVGLVNQYELAAQYGVSQTIISNIVTYKKWRHVA